MFRAARLVLLNKIDLAPHLAFDVAAFKRHARQVNPGLDMMEVSALTGEGMEAWYGWLRERRDALGRRPS